VLVLVQEGKLACTSFPLWWNDVVRDALVLLQDGKLARASCPPCWNDVSRDVIVLGGKLSHLMMLIEMSLFLCKREN
jgi:hypothetical protein